ncbi:DUF485 domain-containing protein [Streptomyces agglomeratus]|uniref:DUF485 domain-containing protein n=1 Tax=Streptomyces agglomeratus TaxID=285458 RepID=UPI00099F581B|nr:DUF485 domain-containing protein [Streptomyces agglomeratus]
MSYQRPFPDPPPSRNAWAGGAVHAWDAPTRHEEHREQPHPHSLHMDLDALRSGYRKLRRVSTFTALAYFVLFLIFSAFTPDMMTSEITGGLNIGLVLGLCQLPVALAAIALYERIARNRIDPLSATIQEQTLQAAQDSRSPRRRHVPRASVPAYPVGQEQWQEQEQEQQQWQWPDGSVGGGRS